MKIVAHRTIQEDYNLSPSKKDTLGTIQTTVQSRGKAKIYVVNAHIFCEGLIDPSYQSLIREGTINTCDGVNVRRLVKKTAGTEIDLFPGPDLFKTLVQDAELGSLKHFFLGGTPEVSKGLQHQLGTDNKLYFSPPFVKDPKDFDYDHMVTLLEAFEPDIIWVGLGAPKQERVIDELYKRIDRGVLIGVGAAFNFYSGIGSLKRAPEVFRKLHLEWLYRLFQEPKRIAKRQSRNLAYLIKGYFKYKT